MINTKRNRQLKSGGFTIIELMIATAVLATMLLLVTVVMINIGSLYYKGINQARVQDDTRNITDQVTQQLQLSDQTPAAAPGPHNTHAYCIGDARYTYVIGVQLGGLAPGTATTYRHVLWRDVNPTPGSCFIDPADPQTITPVDLTQNTPSPGGTELVSGSSRLTAFSIGGISPFALSVGVAYGDNDLLCSPSVAGSCNTSAAMAQWADYRHGDLLCKGNRGDQFCSTAQLQTTVVQRL